MKIKPFTLIHTDDDIIGVNKPAGLLVAADRWDDTATRLDELLNAELPRIAPHCQKLYAVHRIDKDTSGLILYALNAEAHRNLNTAFQNREVKKTYHVIVHGRVSEEQFSVNLPLRADGDALHRTIVDKRRGKEALTHFTLLESFGRFSLLAACPVTGRTHQIRVHLAEAGYPIVCDPLYGSSKPIFLSALKQKWRGDIYTERPLIQRLALHAYRIESLHPCSGVPLALTAEYAKDFKSLVYQLRKL